MTGFTSARAERLGLMAWLVLGCALTGCDSAQPSAIKAAAATTRAVTRPAAPRNDSDADDEVIDPIDTQRREGSNADENDEPNENPLVAGEGRLSPAARAVDEIASEIYESLSHKSVRVVWLFDATTSAEPLRKEVVERLARNGPILDRCAKSGTDHELRWSAVAFGQQAELLLANPTLGAGALMKAVESIADDTSGVENTFAAIEKAADEWVGDGGAHDRYVFFIVVTDEVGDDADRVDEVARRLKKRSVQTYVIGPAAPFGYEGSLTPVAEVENWRLVRQGPESREVELVDVTASGRSQAAALMDSGRGPFALTYLTLETDGEFFVVHRAPEALPAGADFSPAAGVVRFDPEVIGRYLPEYVSAEEYRRLQNDNPARLALAQAAKLPNIALATDLKREFAQKDPAALKRQLDEAQRAVARLEPRLRQFYETLAAGEADRGRLPPRWRANYDLAMGRVLAARARLEGYNAMLARLKSNGTFRQPDSTRWVLTEADTFAGDSVLNKVARRAREYLERVVSEHSGTPWAWLAERELQVPMAWNWVER
ncbi:MAG TPA: vWA domain-containing protein [Pirellulales bacterium]|nr:vWA domain-containing protein [Pirellulales bacterium]